MAGRQKEIVDWATAWMREGSHEFGAELYYGVNLLAWINLADFAQDQAMQSLATKVIDLFLLDAAGTCFAGAINGAAQTALRLLSPRCGP